MAKLKLVDASGSRLKYSKARHADYLKMNDVIRLRWRHIFDGKSHYNTNMFRVFITAMWKLKTVSLADACLMLPELKSHNTQREYIYKLYDNGILESDVYVGTDKDRRDMEISYGRGKSSPSLWLSEDARMKVDIYLDKAVEEVMDYAEDARAQKRILPPKALRSKVMVESESD